MRENWKGTLALLGSICMFCAMWWGHQHVRDHLTEQVHTELTAGRLVTLQGTVSRAYRNEEGMLLLNVGPTGATVLIMPSIGSLPFTPRTGDQVTIVARREDGEQGSTFYPVSRNHVERIGRPPVISLTQARTRAKGERVRLRVEGTAAAVKTSNAGKRHLHVTVRDATGQSDGILWEGTYSDSDISLFRSGNPLLIEAEVDSFQGKLSLVILWAEEA